MERGARRPPCLARSKSRRYARAAQAKRKYTIPPHACPSCHLAGGPAVPLRKMQAFFTAIFFLGLLKAGDCIAACGRRRHARSPLPPPQSASQSATVRRLPVLPETTAFYRTPPPLPATAIEKAPGEPCGKRFGLLDTGRHETPWQAAGQSRRRANTANLSHRSGAAASRAAMRKSAKEFAQIRRIINAGHCHQTTEGGLTCP